MEFFSQLAALLNKFELLWGEKIVGSVSDRAPAVIDKNNGVAAS
jgi:hypothetical protein